LMGNRRSRLERDGDAAHLYLDGKRLGAIRRTRAPHRCFAGRIGQPSGSCEWEASYIGDWRGGTAVTIHGQRRALGALRQLLAGLVRDGQLVVSGKGPT